MFDTNNHNRTGTQKEVKQCCNCLHNDHSANDRNEPCIICTNPKTQEWVYGYLAKKQGFVYVAYKVYERTENDDLIESIDFEEQLTGFPLWCPLKKD